MHCKCYPHSCTCNYDNSRYMHETSASEDQQYASITLHSALRRYAQAYGISLAEAANAVEKTFAEADYSDQLHKNGLQEFNRYK